ncbi:MAG: type II toxin-antitoxin system RelE family toxin [Thermoplasmatota archaeon]
MTWRVELTESAHRDLLDLDPPVAARVVKKLEKIIADPLRSMGRLRGGHDWKLRVGEWRIVCFVDVAKRLISVDRIQHRSVVYGRR